MEGENDLINVLSMDNISNRDVTAYYMDTIYKAAQEYGSANRFDFTCLPEKDIIYSPGWISGEKVNVISRD